MNDIKRVPNDTPHQLQIELGPLIRQMRRECGLQQKELAKRMGVSQPLLNRWERGTRDIKAKQLMKLADLCNVTIKIDWNSYD